MKIFLSVVFTTIVLLCSGQSSQSEYLEAKRQYALGNYSAAQRSFQTLTEDKTFGSYSSFYYALCALKQDDKQQAYDMFRQIQLKNPDWKSSEINYWLGYVAFKQQKYWEAFSHLENASPELRESLIRTEMSNLSLQELESAYALNKDNEYIGSYLTKAIMKQPYDERDHILLAELSEKYGFTVKGEEIDLPLIKKDNYAIAAVLPFMFDSLNNPQSVIRNPVIFHLYQGMKKAEKDLKEENINLEIFPFDTQKKATTTRQIILDGSLENADVIVGPLYGGPNKVVSQYSKDEQITMVNPLSSTGDIIGDNPFSFLFKPSYKTQGRIAADYAKKQYTKNKKAFVFYETDRDSLIAGTYLKAIEQDSFFVVRFERLTNESAQQVQKDFIEQYEVRLDTAYSIEEMDSIALIPGRYVKTRPLRDQDDGSIIRDDEGEEVIEYYENRFKVKEDSIGHIFAATSSNLLANNFISLAEVRSDTVGIIGYSNWLDFSLVSFAQLERLGIAFIHADFADKSSDNYKELKKEFITELGREPDKFHLIGYELITQLGRLLSEHGKYFQRGLLDGKEVSGFLMEGLKYGTYNDNQIVPITQLQQLRLINQNSQQSVTQDK